MPYMTGLCIEINSKEYKNDGIKFSVDDGMDEVVADVTMEDLINLRDQLTVFIEGDTSLLVVSGFGKI